MAPSIAEHSTTAQPLQHHVFCQDEHAGKLLTSKGDDEERGRWKQQGDVPHNLDATLLFGKKQLGRCCQRAAERRRPWGTWMGRARQQIPGGPAQLGGPRRRNQLISQLFRDIAPYKVISSRCPMARHRTDKWRHRDQHKSGGPHHLKWWWSNGCVSSHPPQVMS